MPKCPNCEYHELCAETARKARDKMLARLTEAADCIEACALPPTEAAAYLRAFAAEVSLEH